MIERKELGVSREFDEPIYMTTILSPEIKNTNRHATICGLFTVSHHIRKEGPRTDNELSVVYVTAAQ